MIGETIGRVLVAERERRVREVAVTYLPPRLRWVAEHPRLLKLAWALRPRWRPKVTHAIDPGRRGGPVAIMSSRDGKQTVIINERWL